MRQIRQIGVARTAQPLPETEHDTRTASRLVTAAMRSERKVRRRRTLPLRPTRAPSCLEEAARLLPFRSPRHSARAGSGPDREGLVDLDLTVFKSQGRARQVQSPHSRAACTSEPDRLGVALLEVVSMTLENGANATLWPHFRALPTGCAPRRARSTHSAREGSRRGGSPDRPAL
jgi:hypothetical protein